MKWSKRPTKNSMKPKRSHQMKMSNRSMRRPSLKSPKRCPWFRKRHPR